MCGIAGFIGLSKKPKATSEIMTNLFDYLEFRGTDASGIWATEGGKNGKVYYHKEPIKSSEFIKKDFWKKIRKAKLNLLLAHARATSRGNGHASTNSNNHPFVSLDKRIGMVHNGTIDEAEFLSKKYQCVTNTDSEVILRIFEAGMKDEMKLDDIPEKISHRLGGIKDVWATITEGAMAVALGEREDDSQRNLFLFRNDQRPLWLADLRSSLGQIFFFSSPDIWYRAMSACPDNVQAIIKNQKLHEIPPNEVWALCINDEMPQIVDPKNQFFRFKMDVKNTGKDWGDEFFHIQPPKSKVNVVTELELGDEIKKPNALIIHKPKPVVEDDIIDIDVDDYQEPFNNICASAEHDVLCQEIVRLAKDISTMCTNACLEGTISENSYQQILESLETTKIDLQGTQRLIGD